MARLALALVFLTVSTWAGPTGYLSVQADSLPSEIYVDNRVVIADSGPRIVEAEPGRHFVSLFPPKKVYLAFRSDAPEQFWDGLRKHDALAGDYELLSSYERGAVRVGTEWVYVVPGDTVPVVLSHRKVLETYRRDSACVLGTFLGWTLLIGAGMIASILLARLD